MVVWGHKNTTSITMDEMIHHCKSVSRSVQRPFVVGDLPFGAYNTVDLALENATRLVKEGGVDAIKLEGANECLFDIVILFFHTIFIHSDDEAGGASFPKSRRSLTLALQWLVTLG
jgi:ketopantoate hydroxymethyltransferase